jgi:hypothetical protein
VVRNDARLYGLLGIGRIRSEWSVACPRVAGNAEPPPFLFRILLLGLGSALERAAVINEFESLYQMNLGEEEGGVTALNLNGCVAKM